MHGSLDLRCQGPGTRQRRRGHSWAGHRTAGVKGWPVCGRLDVYPSARILSRDARYFSARNSDESFSSGHIGEAIVIRTPVRFHHRRELRCKPLRSMGTIGELLSFAIRAAPSRALDGPRSYPYGASQQIAPEATNFSPRATAPVPVHTTPYVLRYHPAIPWCRQRPLVIGTIRGLKALTITPSQ